MKVYLINLARNPDPEPFHYEIEKSKVDKAIRFSKQARLSCQVSHIRQKPESNTGMPSSSTTQSTVFCELSNQALSNSIQLYISTFQNISRLPSTCLYYA